jgi:hypothetical protein
MLDQTSVVEQSDHELLVRIAAGDPAAGTALLSRHRDAVADLARDLDTAAYDSVEASGRAALRWVRDGVVDLPFRAGWLALHAGGTLPKAAPAPGEVWAAFMTLPAAWRLAIWHREVEGQRVGEIGHHLAMSEGETTRALGSSYAALKRHAAISHDSSESSAGCQDLVNRYRFTPPAFLAGVEVRALREHGRHCDDCLPLIRDLFVIEHALHDTLARVVLGPAAGAYLARRPRALRLRVPSGSSVTFRVKVRPVLTALSATAVGAAAMALVFANPVLSPAPGDPSAAPRATLPVPQNRVGPVSPLSPDLSGSDAARLVSPLDPASGAKAPGPSAQGQGQGQGPDSGDGTAPEPASPDGPGVTPEPEQPTVPGLPGPDDGDGGTPPAEDPGPIDLEATPEEVTVSVDPVLVPAGPVVVTVPVPEEVPLSLPVVAPVLAPLAGSARVAP